MHLQIVSFVLSLVFLFFNQTYVNASGVGESKNKKIKLMEKIIKDQQNLISYYQTQDINNSSLHSNRSMYFPNYYKFLPPLNSVSRKDKKVISSGHIFKKSIPL